MQHQSLTAEITSKAKKHLHNFQPTFFSEIPYQNATQINYLKDLEHKKQSLDFPIFEFEKDFGQEAPPNDFDRLANTLYKKIMQQGYIQQKKAPSKKKKKTKNPLEYDYEDEWINDEEAITIKKNIFLKVQNFKCFPQNVDDFYNSELYKSSLSQIQQQSKKKTNEITMDAHQIEQIKKKMKQNVFITHNRAKEQLQTEKPTMISQNYGREPKIDANLNMDQVNLVKSENSKGQDAQSVSDVKDDDSGPKILSKSSKSGNPSEKSKNDNPQEKSKKNKKIPPKTKPLKKPSKSEKKPKEQMTVLENKKNEIQEEKKMIQSIGELLEVKVINSENEQNIQVASKGLEELEIENQQKAGDRDQMVDEGLE